MKGHEIWDTTSERKGVNPFTALTTLKVNALNPQSKRGKIVRLDFNQQDRVGRLFMGCTFRI